MRVDQSEDFAMLVEIDLQTLLFVLGVSILGATAGFVWSIHKGWLSVD